MAVIFCTCSSKQYLGLGYDYDIQEDGTYIFKTYEHERCRRCNSYYLTLKMKQVFKNIVLVEQSIKKLKDLGAKTEHEIRLSWR